MSRRMPLLLPTFALAVGACSLTTSPDASQCPNDIYRDGIVSPYYGCYALIDSMGPGMASFAKASGSTLVIRAPKSWTWDLGSYHGAGSFEDSHTFINLVDTVNASGSVWAAQRSGDTLAVSGYESRYLFAKVR